MSEIEGFFKTIFWTAYFADEKEGPVLNEFIVLVMVHETSPFYPVKGKEIGKQVICSGSQKIITDHWDLAFWMRGSPAREL